MDLSEIIEAVRPGVSRNDDLWLYIVGDADALTLDTECELAEVLIDEDDDYEEIVPVGFKQRGLAPAIDRQTLKTASSGPTDSRVARIPLRAAR